MGRAIQGGKPSGVKRVGVRELRLNLPSLLKEASLGQTFLVTSRRKVVAEIRPPSVETAVERRPGGLEGKIVIAPDFDVWPDDVVDAMAGGND